MKKFILLFRSKNGPNFPVDLIFTFEKKMKKLKQRNSFIMLKKIHLLIGNCPNLKKTDFHI